MRGPGDDLVEAMSVAEDLEREIREFSGDQLSIHYGPPPPAHRPDGEVVRACNHVDEHHAHVYLNTHRDEATMVHELLHVKYAWILRNPSIKADERLHPDIRGAYATINEGIEHIYVLREQDRLGFPVPTFFGEDYLKIVAGLEKASERDVKVHGGLANVFLRYAIIENDEALSRLDALFAARGLTKWAADFSRAIWKKKNNTRSIAKKFYDEGLFDNAEAGMIVRDIQTETFQILRFAEI